MLLLGICGCSGGDRNTNAAATEEEETTFPFTAEEFRKRYNKFALQMDNKFVIKKKFNIEKGATVDVFELDFEKGISIVGTVSQQNGLLRGVMLILENENSEFLTVFLTTAYAVTDGVLKEEIDKVVLEMLKEAAGTEKNIQLIRKVGSLQYSMDANNLNGMFSIYPLSE
ncbi:hypothetical protein FACS189487_00030 [Campylobacterota bacterium]|nr:hypothetical protein FACS189487_00030 [Campylobacterota bacterium]